LSEPCPDGYPHVDLTVTGPDLWQASTAYVLDDFIQSAAGDVFICTTAGTSDGTAPTWDTTPGNSTNDGTAVWKCLGTINIDWCGNTWTLPANSGAINSVCPTSYNLNNTGNDVGEGWAFWPTTGWNNLELTRRFQFLPTYSTTIRNELVLIAPRKLASSTHALVGFFGIDGVSWLPTTPQRTPTFATQSSLWLNVAWPRTIGMAAPTASDFQVADWQFGNYSKRGLTFTWARNADWT